MDKPAKKIAIADDEPNIRELIKSFLKNAGYEVQVFENGDDLYDAFMVDEPELSLHVAWQELFVDAVANANPGLQMILATHAPSIILDRIDKCVDLAS